VQEITPTYNELVIDTSTSNDGPTLPWSLVRVDRDLNRIYLTASNSDCVFPKKVRLEETSTSITLTVVGVGGKEEDVPSSVELRWRPDNHQATFTISS